jgi:hypothetical protein
MGRGIARSARSVAQEDRGHPIGRHQRAGANPCRREGGAISASPPDRLQSRSPVRALLNTDTRLVKSRYKSKDAYLAATSETACNVMSSQIMLKAYSPQMARKPD